MSESAGFFGRSTRLVRSASITILLIVAMAGSAAAQRGWSATLGGGYTSSNGYHHYWDDGSVVAIRSAVWRSIGRRLDLGLEGGLYLYGTHRSSFRCDGGTECGGTGFTTTSERSTRAWTADLALRWRPGGSTVRPQLSVGLGVGERRDLEHIVHVEDGVTNELDYPTTTDLLPLAALGAGLEIGPPGGRFALTTGLRGDFTFDAYDGTPTIARLLTATVGVVVR
jgi:hypothetical protein